MAGLELILSILKQKTKERAIRWKQPRPGPDCIPFRLHTFRMLCSGLSSHQGGAGSAAAVRRSRPGRQCVEAGWAGAVSRQARLTADPSADMQSSGHCDRGAVGTSSHTAVGLGDGVTPSAPTALQAHLLSVYRTKV